MILFTHLSCEAFGLAENIEAKCVAYSMSGLDKREFNLVGQLLINTPKLKIGLLLPNLYATVALLMVCILGLNRLVLLI